MARLRQVWIDVLLVLKVKLTTEAILRHIVGDASLSKLLCTTEVVAVADIAQLVGQDGHTRIDHFRCIGELLTVQNKQILILVEVNLRVLALVLEVLDLGRHSMVVFSADRHFLFDVPGFGADNIPLVFH